MPTNSCKYCSILFQVGKTALLALKVYNNNYYDTKYFISLFERALKVMKNGFYFILITLLVEKLCKILIYKN